MCYLATKRSTSCLRRHKTWCVRAHVKGKFFLQRGAVTGCKSEWPLNKGQKSKSSGVCFSLVQPPPRINFVFVVCECRWCDSALTVNLKPIKLILTCMKLNFAAAIHSKDVCKLDASWDRSFCNSQSKCCYNYLLFSMKQLQCTTTFLGRETWSKWSICF